jgi:hypothetical protein
MSQYDIRNSNPPKQVKYWPGDICPDILALNLQADGCSRRMPGQGHFVGVAFQAINLESIGFPFVRHDRCLEHSHRVDLRNNVDCFPALHRIVAPAECLSVPAGLVSVQT